MSGHRPDPAWIPLICWATCVGFHCDARAEVVIIPLERHTNEFSGRDVRRSFRIAADKPLAGRLVWSLSTPERTFDRGEQELQGADGAAEVTIKFHVNALRDEIQMPVRLQVAVVTGQDEVSHKTIGLRLFADDPFGSRGEWLRSLDISLFDPAEHTARQFEDARIACRLVRHAATWDAPVRQGVWIIGEGVSLRQHRGLAETAVRAAASGRRVVLLAPADGSFTVPGTEGDGLPDGRLPSELRFAREPVIAEFDKHLDASVWPGSGNTVPASRLLVASYRGRVEATVSEGSRGWPWLQVRFPEHDGELVICGFRIIEHWKSGPTPRFLLLRLLETLSPPAPAE